MLIRSSAGSKPARAGGPRVDAGLVERARTSSSSPGRAACGLGVAVVAAVGVHDHEVGLRAASPRRSRRPARPRPPAWARSPRPRSPSILLLGARVPSRHRSAPYRTAPAAAACGRPAWTRPGRAGHGGRRSWKGCSEPLAAAHPRAAAPGGARPRPRRAPRVHPPVLHVGVPGRAGRGARRSTPAEPSRPRAARRRRRRPAGPRPAPVPDAAGVADPARRPRRSRTSTRAGSPRRARRTPRRGAR